MQSNNLNPRSPFNILAAMIVILALAFPAIAIANPQPSGFLSPDCSIVLAMHDTAYTDVEIMPMFRGCEGIEDLDKRKNCSDTKMLEFIHQNITYPEAARKADTEGTVVVRFIVERDGSVTNIEVVRKVSEPIDEESLRVVQLMQEEIMWSPGLHGGIPVRVIYNLPVRFRLTE